MKRLRKVLGSVNLAEFHRCSSEITQDAEGKTTTISAVFSIGYRSNLGDSMRKTKALMDEEFSGIVGVSNGIVAGAMAYLSWLETSFAPFKGGAFMEINRHEETYKFKKVTPVLSEFQFEEMRVNAEKASLTGTQMKGKNLFIDANELFLLTAFSSLEQSSGQISGRASIPTDSNGFKGAVSTGEGQQSTAGTCGVRIDLGEQLWIKLTGDMTQDGWSIYAL